MTFWIALRSVFSSIFDGKMLPENEIPEEKVIQKYMYKEAAESIKNATPLHQKLFFWDSGMIESIENRLKSNENYFENLERF